MKYNVDIFFISEDMKKILIVSYVATVAVSKFEFTEKEAKLVDKMWKKTTENVAKLGRRTCESMIIQAYIYKQ